MVFNSITRHGSSVSVALIIYGSHVRVISKILQLRKYLINLLQDLLIDIDVVVLRIILFY